MKEIIVYILCGAAGGVLGGMGMGGGTLLIPLLTVFAGLGQHEAQAINLAAFVPMSIAALVVHGKNGLIEIKGLFPLMITGAVFGVVGSFIGKNIKGAILRKIFGGFLVVLAVVQFFSDKISAAVDKKRSESRFQSE